MNADMILDRRRMRRRVTFWRVAAFIFLALALIALLSEVAGIGASDKLRGDQFARVNVDGFIGIRPAQVKTLKKLGEEDKVKAVILRINSPGGAAVGGEALYNAVLALGTEKPVVAVIDGLGTSAAYMTAVAADHIIAREAAITGSIGVIFQFGNFQELLEKIGVRYDQVVSGPLKGQPSMFGPPSPDGMAMLQSVVDETYDWFVGLVAERRDISVPKTRALADGSIYAGRQALDLQLIDELGDEDSALAWLAKEHGLDKDLPVRDWKPSESTFDMLSSRSIFKIAELLGLDPLLIPAADSILPRRLLVDGLLSVWQAPGSTQSDR